MNKRSLRNLSAAVAAISLTATPVLAMQASQVRDLIGARGSSGESQLQARGYTYITGNLGRHNTKHSYWWNAGQKHCIHVETSDGRYSNITDAKKRDCNQHGGGGDTAAAIGAVAAVGLIAALAGGHKKHHHEDNRHYDDVNDESHYDRGYNDGVHNTAYHNWDNSTAYSDGYAAGVGQRAVNTSYHHGYGGYTSKAQFRDLNHQDAKYARGQLESRGFMKVDQLDSPNGDHYSVFYRAGSSQCVQATVVNHRIYDIRDIGRHPACR